MTGETRETVDPFMDQGQFQFYCSTKTSTTLGLDQMHNCSLRKLKYNVRKNKRKVHLNNVGETIMVSWWLLLCNFKVKNQVNGSLCTNAKIYILYVKRLEHKWMQHSGGGMITFTALLSLENLPPCSPFLCHRKTFNQVSQGRGPTQGKGPRDLSLMSVLCPNFCDIYSSWHHCL